MPVLNKARAVGLLSAVAGLCLGFAIYGCHSNQPDSSARADNPMDWPPDPSHLSAQIPGRDLRSSPPEVSDASVQLAAPGKAVLKVRFAESEKLPEQLKLNVDNQVVVLRQEPQAGRNVFTGTIPLDVREFEQQQQHIKQLAEKARGGLTTPVFRNRELIELRPVEVGEFQVPNLGSFVPIKGLGLPSGVDSAKSLAINDLSVVEDPGRTFNPCTGTGTAMGKWTFGYLMEQMCNQPVSGITPSDFVMTWLNAWMTNQTINGWMVTARPSIKQSIIDPWVQKSGGPGQPLDLSKAPFRLLAIVNRIDLHQNLVYGGGSAGEARFVFCAMDSNCNPLPFTVIFEYGIRANGCLGLKAWARKWFDLGSMTPGTPAYNAALEQITESFVKAGANPAKPNGSALNQLRTDEIAIGSPWQLREFHLVAGGNLQDSTVAQAPDSSLNNSSTVAAYITANGPAIVAQTNVVPLSFGPGHFLGGSGDQVPQPGMFWNGNTTSLNGAEARRMFSLNTCTGCHAGETNTLFTHISPAPFGAAAGLSGFLTGINVSDPSLPPPGGPTPPLPPPAVSPPWHTYADLERRAAELDQIVNAPCIIQIFHRPLRMVH